MSGEILRYLQGQGLGALGRDFLDVMITYYVFYRVALVLKGTRAMQVGVGVASVFLVYIVAQLLHLQTVLTLLQAVLSSAILIGVVVFQNDIRRGLMRMGSRAQFGSSQTLEGKVVDDVVEAATILARHRIGAIITFEQEANLDEFVGSHTGHVIDAVVSAELLVSMFIPEGMNKLHDGALIIRDLRIAKAGVFFPMPEGKVMDESFGSRHRAAMGITEETDAVVVIVSEERGSISFCFNGNIVSNLDGDRLRAALEGVFAPKKPTKKRGMLSMFGLGAPPRREDVAEAIRKTVVPLETALAAETPPSIGASQVANEAAASAAHHVSTDAVLARSANESVPESGRAALSPPHYGSPSQRDASEQNDPSPAPAGADRGSVAPAVETGAHTPDPGPKPLRKLVSAESSAEPNRKSTIDGEVLTAKKKSEVLHTPLRHLATKPKEPEAPRSERQPMPVANTPKRESTPPPSDPAARRLSQRSESEPSELADGEAS